MRKKISASLAVGVIGAMLALVTGTGTALADSQSINFEAGVGGYTPGSIDGQNGWAGSGGSSINLNIDQAVAPNTTGGPSFGAQSFRMSNSFTSGGFGDWPFSPSLAEAAGDSDGVNHGGGLVTDPVNLKRHFEYSVDVASTDPINQQPGLSMTLSPDRGDGARMSYLRFNDTPAGLTLTFRDYQDIAPYGFAADPEYGSVTPNPQGCSNDPQNGGLLDNFYDTTIGPFSRSQDHTIKVSMDLFNGPITTSSGYSLTAP